MGKRTSKKPNLLAIVGFSILMVFIIVGKNKLSDFFNGSKETVTTPSTQTESTTVEEEKTTCGVCGKLFDGNGYEEQADGSWKELEYPYQGTICSPECGRKNLENLHEDAREIEELSSNNNGSGDYYMGNDGRVYENNACGLCKGTGFETGWNVVTGEQESRICPMCDGKGVRSY